MSGGQGASKAWAWVAGAFVALLGIVIFVLKTLAKDKAGAKMALADAAEKNAKRDIDIRNRELADLKKDVVTNAGKIEKAEAAIEQRKAKLKQKFESQGLSGAEIASRFKRITL